MNREIKFRGLCVNTPNKWAIGDLLQKKEPLIFERSQVTNDDKGLFFKVKKESIGQFTGLYDKKGVAICEGDLLKTDSDAIMVVKYRDDMCQFVCSFSQGASTCIQSSWEVIGNIHQTPELLK